MEGNRSKRRVEGDLALHAGQRRPDAVVDAPAEAQRRVARAAQVELVGLLETGRVAVGRALQDDDAVAPRERLAQESAGSSAVRRLNCTGLSKRSSSSTAAGRSRDAPASPPADRGGRATPAARCPAGSSSSRSRRRRAGWRSSATSSSVSRSSLLAGLDAASSAGRRGGGAAAPRAAPRSTPRGRRWRRCAASISSSPSTGSIPLAAARTCGCRRARSAAGHAHQLADHGHGQRQRELGHELDVAPLGEVVEQLLDQLVHGRPQALDLAGGERARDQPAQAGVVRRVRQSMLCCDGLEELAAAGCRRRRRSPSRCPRCPHHGRAAGHAARPGIPRSR